MAWELVFDHGSISVGSIEEGVVFYRDVLGLTQIPRPEFGFPGAWFLAGTMPVHLTTGGFVRGSDAELKPNDFHLAFRVDEGLDELVSSLKDSDVPVYELADSPAAERQVFVQDPWGNVIELCKY